MIGLAFICAACTRFRAFDEDHPSAYCAAFPDGIPDSIMYGMADHRLPVEGDHGIRFVLDPDRKDVLASYVRIKKSAKERSTV